MKMKAKINFYDCDDKDDYFVRAEWIILDKNNKLIKIILIEFQ